MREGDTIVSLATIAGESALGVIRVSGKLCKTLCEDIFNITTPTPRTATVRNYLSINGKTVDQVLLTFFENGKSYTGEQTIELTFHGNPLIANQILDDLIKRKCRLAEPGEYTKRAFLNGKIDLSQAEAVAELISASSEIEIEIANHQLRGSLSKRLHVIQSGIINLQAQFEASIDFPEDEIKEKNVGEILTIVKPLKSAITQLINSTNIKSTLSQGIKISLIGPPNVGKSTLFNNLVHENRALVSKDSGTTRDYLSKELNIGGYKVELFDTAGIRKTTSEVEQLGIQNSIRLIDDSAIVLLVFDSSLPYPTEFYNSIRKEIKSKAIIVVENKNDLKREISSSDYPRNSKVITTSMIEDGCSENIISEIEKVLSDQFKINPSSDILVNKRQSNHLVDALAHLDEVVSLISSSINEEIILQELKLSIECINSIIGRTDNEDMLDQLFKNFCIGK